MAKKTVRVGSVGPFIYEDANHDGVETNGTITANQFSQEVGSSSVRLLQSDANKNIEEVSTLANYLAAGIAIAVSDDGNGGATIDVNININVLTDNSGGSTDGTVGSVSGTSDDSTINNNFAELTQRLNSLINELT